MRYVQRNLRVFLSDFCPCGLKTTLRRTLRVDVLWHQNKATQSAIKCYSEIFDNIVGQWILFVVGQRILFGVSSWHLVWEATWFIHDSQLCGNPKTQSCGYEKCACTNRTMVIDAILQTRVSLEIRKNKEFLNLTIWKKVKTEKEKSW